MITETSTTSKLLARNLQYYRKKANLSQEQFAEKLRVSNNTISKIETGRSFPKPSLIDSMAEMLHIKVSSLFDENYKEKEIIQGFSTTVNQILEITGNIQSSCHLAKTVLEEREYIISHAETPSED